MKDLNALIEGVMGGIEADARKYSEPHYENDENTWGAISTSAYIDGARAVGEPLAKALRYCIEVLEADSSGWEIPLRAILERAQDSKAGENP